MTIDEDDLLRRMFRHFAEVEFRDESPVYARLAARCADDLTLVEPLRRAPRRQWRALLLFAAVQYLLRTADPGHPLAAYFPTLGGDRGPDDALVPAFIDVLGRHQDRLAELCATRRTQTNEARRSAFLRPAFIHAAGGRPIALIELGTSAGLLLLPDRYAYEYVSGDTVARVGRPDAPPALVMTCAVRDGGWPAPALEELPDLVSRTGIDLGPVDPTNPDAVDWLRSCIWPEQVDRLARLDAALAEARAVRPRFITGDLLAELPAAVSSVDSSVLPVVFTSHAITYLPGALQRELIGLLATIGGRRDFTVIVNEEGRAGLQLFSRDAPLPPADEVISTVAMVRWSAGSPTVTRLALAGPHGGWLAWQPYELPYQPKE